MHFIFTKRKGLYGPFSSFLIKKFCGFDSSGSTGSQVWCLWVLTSTKSAEMIGKTWVDYSSSAVWDGRKVLERP